MPALMLYPQQTPAIIGDTLKNERMDFLRKPYIAEELIRKVDFWIDYRKKAIKLRAPIKS